MTAISVIDDYHFGIVSPQPVVSFGPLPATAVPAGPVEEGEAVKRAPKAKVVKAPEVEVPDSTEGVETK
jgi:hypothetical protein